MGGDQAREFHLPPADHATAPHLPPAIGAVTGSGPPPGRPSVARCPVMGSDRRTFLRSLLAGGVLFGGGLGRAARALNDGPSGIRVEVLPVRAAPRSVFPGAAGGLIQFGALRLPFPATHLGLRWQGSEADLVEICWQVAGEWGAWHRPSIWHDAGDHDAGVVAAGLVRPALGATRLGVRWSAGA